MPVVEQSHQPHQTQKAAKDRPSCASTSMPTLPAVRTSRSTRRRCSARDHSQARSHPGDRRPTVLRHAGERLSDRARRGRRPTLDAEPLRRGTRWASSDLRTDAGRRRRRWSGIKNEGTSDGHICRTILLVIAASTFSAVAEAIPATLHLSAIVYDTHQSKGVFSSKERVFQGTTKVGEDYSRCTEASSTTVHCVGSYTLQHGTIRFSGTISNASDTNRLTITAGTGNYKGARGTVRTEYRQSRDEGQRDD